MCGFKEKVFVRHSVWVLRAGNKRDWPFLRLEEKTRREALSEPPSGSPGVHLGPLTCWNRKLSTHRLPAPSPAEGAVWPRVATGGRPSSARWEEPGRSLRAALRWTGWPRFQVSLIPVSDRVCARLPSAFSFC